MNPNDNAKTPIPKVGEIERGWVLIDAEGAVLGRLATRVATLLMGKHKPNYTPHLITGDNVIIVNAEKVRVTGDKLKQKKYYRHSGYWGGLHERTLKEQLERKPTAVIEAAVSRMVNRSSRKGRHLMANLKVYAGTDHPHKAQKPVEMKLDR